MPNIVKKTFDAARTETFKVASNVRSSPLKYMAGICAAITTIFGSFVTFDSRYAHADDLMTLKESQTKMANEQRGAIRDLRRQQLEDKIFELNLKPKPTQPESALKQHYQQQLNDLRSQENNE